MVRAVLLPSGLDTRVHWYDNRVALLRPPAPAGVPEPSRSMVEPTSTDWLLPALTKGAAVRAARTVTLRSGLLARPSLTTKRTT